MIEIERSQVNKSDIKKKKSSLNRIKSNTQVSARASLTSSTTEVN